VPWLRPDYSLWMRRRPNARLLQAHRRARHRHRQGRRRVASFPKRCDGHIAVLGTCDYNGKFPERAELTAQARRVGASIVIFEARQIATIAGTRSVTIQQPAQVYRVQRGAPYGDSYSAVAAAENETVTVPGGYTHYEIPYALDRFEVHEAFLGK
jgi:hypothetical protein